MASAGDSLRLRRFASRSSHGAGNAADDMEMDDITETHMKQGIEESVAVLIVLTTGVMGRPFCQKEMRWAQENRLTFCGVFEQDTRRGPVDFARELQDAPSDLKGVVANTEFLPFRRRRFEAEAMYDQLLKKGKFGRRVSARGTTPQTVEVTAMAGSAVECGGGGESSGGAGDDGEALVDDPDSAIAPWAPARVLVQGAEDSAAANSDSMAV